jgi:phytoene dehydrogenase-like protein
MENFDAIIIGSGVGGLATAICLARAGQKVVVLEQHYVPGGWSHSFTLNGHRFSPGVHYVGLIDEGDSTNDLYRGLGIANDMVFFRMNPKAYEHCLIGDETIDIPAGIDNLKKALTLRFPKEEKNINQYVTLVQNVSLELQLMPKLKGWWQKITVPFRTKNFGKYALFPLKKVIGWHIKEELLKTVLNIQCGDHGLAPNRACFPVHCSVMSHYFNGGFYPMGGGGGIVKAMTNGVKRNGGEVRVKQSVEKIRSATKRRSTTFFKNDYLQRRSFHHLFENGWKRSFEQKADKKIRENKILCYITHLIFDFGYGCDTTWYRFW